MGTLIKVAPIAIKLATIKRFLCFFACVNNHERLIVCSLITNFLQMPSFLVDVALYVHLSEKEEND
ncbi:hypothetical protein GCM10007932_01130 [Vibrio penaeicida]|uniref:DUF3265 domain-containing protein n=1 Tax=Vibrio penaeicida TaxID=104609 RepID=A0AAV5NJG9_9VIBR|nr:hypothetical protein GCM10007932_01130 [Vibrio penaeicida]